MTNRYFGTDGIRGKANEAPMTAEIVLRIAMATALEIKRGDYRHKIVIGKDTRLSGYMLEPSLVAGFISMGMDVVLVGPMPTPAIAMLTQSLRADLGVVISASHNPYYDNGIKFFGADGYKLSDEIQSRIEARLETNLMSLVAPSEDVGRAYRLEDESGRYIEYIKNTLPKTLRFDGLKVVVDCAHGAAYKVAPQVLYELGATVVPVGTSPDGTNINRDCGATSPAILQETVVQQGADIGIALDGDADRIFMCDELGGIVDGDQLMALIAKSLNDEGKLKHNTAVCTVMSNLGLERYLNSHDINVVRTAVGDRHVVKKMRQEGYNFGGEQSGHIIFGDYSSTGDGLLAGLQILSVLKRSDKKASELCQVFNPVPQLLRNVRYTGEVSIEDGPVHDVIKEIEVQLAGTGRILVRKSGTEPVVRVMAESDDEQEINEAVNRVCQTIEDAA